jgi:haloalkane dehalogenase
LWRQDEAVDFVRTSDDRFTDLAGYPFEPRYIDLADGLRMHYIEDGPSGGDPVLLLHGQPTWSYLYRTMLPALAAHGLRAIAPDLIGFGRSDKPTARTDYSVRNHTEWLSKFIEALALTRITVVVQDWGGPIGLGVLVRDPLRFARVVASNTALHTADAALAGRLEWACHAGADGNVVIEPTLLDYQRMTQELRPFRPSVFVQGATTTDLSEDVCAAYDAPFPDEQSSAGARQLPLLMGLTPNSAAARQNRRILEHLEESSVPVLTAFSDGDPGTRGWEGVLQEHAKGAIGQAHCTIEGAGHFVQEDRGGTLAEAIVQFVESNPLKELR